MSAEATMADDVVAELDRQLLHWHEPLLQRVRDEIVALREQLKAVKGIAGNERKLSEAIIQQARDEALEEAARLCEGGYTTGSTASTLKAIAAAIRALKGAER